MDDLGDFFADVEEAAAASSSTAPPGPPASVPESTSTQSLAPSSTPPTKESEAAHISETWSSLPSGSEAEKLAGKPSIGPSVGPSVSNGISTSTASSQSSSSSSHSEQGKKRKRVAVVVSQPAKRYSVRVGSCLLSFCLSLSNFLFVILCIASSLKMQASNPRPAKAARGAYDSSTKLYAPQHNISSSGSLPMHSAASRQAREAIAAATAAAASGASITATRSSASAADDGPSQQPPIGDSSSSSTSRSSASSSGTERFPPSVAVASQQIGFTQIFNAKPTERRLDHLSARGIDNRPAWMRKREQDSRKVGGQGKEVGVLRGDQTGSKWRDKNLEKVNAKWGTNDFRAFIGNIGPESSEKKIFEHLKPLYPSLQDVHLLRDKRTGKIRGYGFMSFSDGFDMIKCIKVCWSCFVFLSTASLSTVS